MKGENRVLFGLARCCPIHKANTQQKFCPTQPRNSVKCKRSWFAAKFSNLLRQLLYPLFSTLKENLCQNSKLLSSEQKKESSVCCKDFWINCSMKPYDRYLHFVYPFVWEGYKFSELATRKMLKVLTIFEFERQLIHDKIVSANMN